MGSLQSGIAPIIEDILSSRGREREYHLGMEDMDSLTRAQRVFIDELSKKHSVRCGQVTEITLCPGLYFNTEREFARKIVFEADVFQIVVLFNKKGYTSRLEWFRDQNLHDDEEVPTKDASKDIFDQEVRMSL